MKLNKKGMTLIELLVSIVLIATVLTFLFQLLLDLKNETESNDFAYNNQVNRTEAINTIQKDLGIHTLTGVADKSSSGNFLINFYYKTEREYKTAVLKTESKTSTDEFGNTIKKYYLRYTSVDGEKYSWEMKGAEIDPCGSFTYYIDSLSSNYYFKLNIYLYNNVYHEKNSKDNNNTVDDIEITYSNLKDDLITSNSSYLTNSTKGVKKIGTCTN